MHIIGVLNPKGGSGKTTLSTNLAKALFHDGYSVLAIDSDPQGTFQDWYAQQEEDEPGPDLAAMDAKAITRGLKRVGSGFDFVLIDGAAKIDGKESAAVVKACDAILIPVQPTPADIWGAGDLVDIIQARQEVTDGAPLAAFVISRQIVGTNLAAEVQTILSGYGLPVFQARTSQRVVFAEAMVSGASVLDVEPSGKAADEITAIKNEMLEFING